MAHKIRRINLAGVGTAGQLISAGPVTLHGYILSETQGTAVVVLFQTSAANPNGNDAACAVGSPTAFQRSIALSSDLAPFLDHEGVYYPGGLAIAVKTGAGQITGDIFVS